jgi:hypothetical protein
MSYIVKFTVCSGDQEIFYFFETEYSSCLLKRVIELLYSVIWIWYTNMNPSIYTLSPHPPQCFILISSFSPCLALPIYLILRRRMLTSSSAREVLRISVFPRRTQTWGNKMQYRSSVFPFPWCNVKYLGLTLSIREPHQIYCHVLGMSRDK